MTLEEMKAIAEKRTKGEWQFRATKDSGGIRFVVAPDGPKSVQGFEFIAADCSHKCNGEFIAMAANNWDKLMAVVEAAKQFIYNFEQDKECQCCNSNSANLFHFQNDHLAKALEELEEQIK